MLSLLQSPKPSVSTTTRTNSPPKARRELQLSASTPALHTPILSSPVRKKPLTTDEKALELDAHRMLAGLPMLSPTLSRPAAATASPNNAWKQQTQHLQQLTVLEARRARSESPAATQSNLALPSPLGAGPLSPSWAARSASSNLSAATPSPVAHAAKLAVKFSRVLKEEQAADSAL